MAVTIKDVAKAAGVSTATVSRVINQLGGYTPEIEEKIKTVIKELGYRRNSYARGLVQQSSQTIGIIMPHMTTSFYSNIVSGIEDVAFENGYSVIVTHAGIEGDRIKQNINLIAERRVDGVIIFSMDLSDEDVQSLLELEIPVMLIASEVVGTTIPFIKVDDYSAAYAAVEYLIGKGHGRIGLAGPSKTDRIAGKPRIRGYLDAMEKHHLTVPDDWIVTGDFSFDAGVMAMESYLKNNANLTAVFCASDEVAMGVMSACYKNHIRVPEDLSVIGYDNSAIASMATPPLTTVAQPFYDMGQLGCNRLLDAIKNGSEIISQIISFDIIERSSVQDISQ